MANHPLWQLTLVRFREFLREPEALFWVFGFPLLLAAGLGLAFRNAPAEVVSIGFVGLGPDAFEQAPSLAVDAFPTLEEGLRALREGRIALLVERPADGRRRLPLRRHESRKGATRACARISRCSRAPAAWIPWRRARS